MKNLRWNIERALIVLALLAVLYFTPRMWLLYGLVYLAVSFPFCVLIGKMLAFNDRAVKPPTDEEKPQVVKPPVRHLRLVVVE